MLLVIEEMEFNLSIQELAPGPERLMGSRAIRKIKMYLFSVDTLVGIAAFFVSLITLAKSDSDVIPQVVTKIGLGVSIAMLGAVVTVFFKVVPGKGDRFPAWLNREFNSAYDDFLGAIETTTAWSGFALVSAVSLAIWAHIVAISDNLLTGVPPLVLSLYIGLLFYVIVAVIQCIIGAIGYMKRKMKFEDLDQHLN